MFRKVTNEGHREVAKSDADYAVSTSGVIVNRASCSISSQQEHVPSLVAVTTPPGNLRMFLLVPNIEPQILFQQKVQICCVQFDFRDTGKMLREKGIKTQTLIELVDFIQSGSEKIIEANQEEMIRMISLNIFRCFSPSSYENTGSENMDLDNDEPFLEPSWPHLQHVYELLLQYVVSSDTDIMVAKRYIDHSFVVKLLNLFDSGDPREREYLKTILHGIYVKSMVHRPFIRKAIDNVLYRFIYETGRHGGIGELLEVLGSIINGFALPMKEEHKSFLERTLIPLHKPKPIAMYHQQLSYCITQFVEKDYELEDTVIRGLLKYWPVTNCQKEILFLDEIEEVLAVARATEFQGCMVPLFRQIARCLNSCHSQVAQRAHFLWSNEHILDLITENSNVILPIIFEALEKNIQSHWNKFIHGLTIDVRNMFLEADGELFEECERQYAEKESKTKKLEEQRNLMCRKLSDVNMDQ